MDLLNEYVYKGVRAGLMRGYQGRCRLKRCSRCYRHTHTCGVRVCLYVIYILQLVSDRHYGNYIGFKLSFTSSKENQSQFFLTVHGGSMTPQSVLYISTFQQYMFIYISSSVCKVMSSYDIKGEKYLQMRLRRGEGRGQLQRDVSHLKSIELCCLLLDTINRKY